MGDLVISVLLLIGLPPILCVWKPGNSRSIGMSFRMRPRKSSRKAARPCSELHSRPMLEKEHVSTGRFTCAIHPPLSSHPNILEKLLKLTIGCAIGIRKDLLVTEEIAESSDLRATEPRDNS